jgi:pimeloyl-ACP methyl ester carboxylesterase
MTTRHTVEVGGQTISWLQSGRGRTAILLHGFPLHAGMWTALHDTTPHGWTLITPDLRNLGESRGSPARSVDDHASDVLALLRHLGCEDAVIGGLSMGGYITLALHRMAPQRCRALVLADTQAAPDTEEAKANRVRLQATARERGAGAVLEAMLPKLVGPAHQTGAVPDQLRAIAASNSAEGVVDALEALKTRPDSAPGLAAITCPTLVIVGADDALTPVAAAETLRDGIPDASLVVVPDAGHMSNLEQPVAFALALWSFLRCPRLW